MIDRKKLIQLVDTTELQFDISGNQCSILWAGNGVVFYPDDIEDDAIVFRDSTELNRELRQRDAIIKRYCEGGMKVYGEK